MKNLATFFYEIQFSFHNKHNNNKKTKFPLPLFLTSKHNNNKKKPQKNSQRLNVDPSLYCDFINVRSIMYIRNFCGSFNSSAEMLPTHFQ